ncbi:MAG: hypothetical protein IJB01_05275 [Bacteroidaceae bacterium]|nr:hypothetical protein [Bacteroidaceae bacterium]
MDNLYVFAIGGSGERVVKSLVMMLATGMNVGAQRIIPVFIDNDEKSKAYLKCKDLIKFYNADPEVDRKFGANTLYKRFDANPEKWGSFFHTQIADPIVLNKTGEAIGNLRDVIGFREDKSNEVACSISEEINLLFTNDDLEMPLSVGFVGNPNIGSIVLNSLSLQDEKFEAIKRSITPNDGVIAVGSLFGGTGAAGMPLVINTFKNLDETHKPILGGIAVLPYFTTDGQPGDNEKVNLDIKRYDVKSDAFLTKTRAALMYYDKHMKVGYDYMYYVGNSEAPDTFRHCRGGANQDNPYHIIEAMAALSVIDFSNMKKQQDIVYKRPVFGFNQENGSLSTNLSGIKNPDFARCLVKFQIMKEMFKGEAKEDYMLKWAVDTNKDYVCEIGFDNVFRDSILGKNTTIDQAWGVCGLMREFDAWMDDLSKDYIKRRFLLYNKTAQGVTADNVTTHFYTDENYGIAKISPAGFIALLNPETYKKADIASHMQKAFRGEYPNTNRNRIAEGATLPMLFKTISLALDKVLDENCIKL